MIEVHEGFVVESNAPLKNIRVRMAPPVPAIGTLARSENLPHEQLKPHLSSRPLRRPFRRPPEAAEGEQDKAGS